jgi:hypothetical protein
MLIISCLMAIPGILVALTIQKCGIVFRLILGTLSICLCILIEAIFFKEPVMARELLAIAMVGRSPFASTRGRTGKRY